MDDSELPSSPRKKLKTDDSQLSGKMEEANATPLVEPEPYDEQLQKEVDVGITEFVSPELSGFSGVLKKRYTDFLVNEILPSGQVVHLDSLKAPKQGAKAEQSTQTETPSSGSVGHFAAPAQAVSDSASKKENVKPDSAPEKSVAKTGAEAPEPEVKPTETAAKWQAYAATPSGTQLSTQDASILGSFFDEETVKEILSLYNRVINSPHRKLREYGTVKSAAISDRELRTRMHQEVRRIFSSRLETSTDDNGAVQFTAASTKSSWGRDANGGRDSGGRNSSGRNPLQKGKLGWRELGGEYLHFSLYKENKDTMEVISYMARSLKMKPQSFQFAGTKDRRGVTVQRVSVYRVYADRLLSVGRTLRNAKIGNYQYQPNGLELGDLTGNEFVITLRDCQFRNASTIGGEEQLKMASQIVGTASKHLSERGFINYYGLQRFGTFSTRTDTIGVKMLQGDFKAAVEAILHYSPVALSAAQNPNVSHDKISSDDKARATALDLFKSTGKSQDSLDILPKKFSAESNIIRHLGGQGRSNDYLSALQCIPRALRLIYVHAYQSLVWNCAASYRWKQFGNRVLEGDLVLVSDHRDKVPDQETAEDVDADGEEIVRPAADDRANSADDIYVRARALTKEEADSGKYTIFDVVLPTPGYDILYPSNPVADFYNSFMGSEKGGGLDPHDMRRPWKDVSLSGSYRKLLAKPVKDIVSDVRSYTKDDEQFVSTDLDRLQSREQDQTALDNRGAAGDNITSNGDAAVETGISEAQQPEQKKIAVILHLQLNASQYATMALRELMKLGGVKTYKADFGGGR